MRLSHDPTKNRPMTNGIRATVLDMATKAQRVEKPNLEKKQDVKKDAAKKRDRSRARDIFQAPTSAKDHVEEAECFATCYLDEKIIGVEVTW